MNHGRRTTKIAVALMAAAAIVLGSPYVGELRGAILTRFPEYYRLIIAGIVLASTAVLLLIAFVRIRDDRVRRYAMLVASVALAAGFGWTFRTGNANVDAVEAFHFVEYGVVTMLFYRVWSARGGISAIVYPMLACIVVGTFDEWVQWFVPERAGELRDVLLNGVSAVSGLLFAIAADPPGRSSPGARESFGRLGTSVAAVTILVGAFFTTVHLGHELRDPEVGTFRSRNTASELESIGRDRALRWRGETPASTSRFSREDQYLSEALWHVRKRNEAFEDGDVAVAWNENRIVEKYYPSVLAKSTHGVSDFEWPAEQRADAEARARGLTAPAVSDANPYPIYIWPKSSFWIAVAAVAVVMAVAGFYADRRRARQALQSIQPPPTTRSPS